MRRKRLTCSVLTLGVVLGGRGEGLAQSYWHDDVGRTQLRIELLKPLIKNADEDFTTGAAFLSASFRAGSAIRFETDLPVSRAAAADFSSTRIGNPYLGIVRYRDERPISWRVGLRVPVASSVTTLGDLAAPAIGILSDPDRFEAFLPDVLTLRGAFEWRQVKPGGLLLGAVLGPSVLIATEDGGDDAEVLGDYGIRIGYRDEGVQAAASFTGRLVFTEDGSLAERTDHRLNGTIELRRGTLRPEFLLRIPLDSSVRDAVGVILGAGLRVVF